MRLPIHEYNEDNNLVYDYEEMALALELLYKRCVIDVKITMEKK